MNEFSDMEIDTALGTVFGIRQWTLGTENNLPSLRGNYGRIWKPGVNTAECEYAGVLRARHPARITPYKTCTCGFYAFWEPEEEPSVPYVLGIIEGWGQTIIGPRGFRCQYAEIRALCGNVRWRKRREIQRVWNVPLFRTVKGMTQFQSTTKDYIPHSKPNSDSHRKFI